MLPETLRQKPLRNWTYGDLDLIIGAEESIGLELKSDLPLKKNSSGWRQTNKLHTSEKEGLGKEIIALANAYGGDLVIGFDETDDHPKRAEKLSTKLLNVDQLVDQLKRSFGASIDPPLVGLEILAVKLKESDTDGYIAIRVPSSLSKPHGYGTPPLTYIRRDDRSEPMRMREMQDRFLEAQTARQRINDEIKKFSLSELSYEIPTNAFAASISVVPSGNIQLANLLSEIRENEFRQLLPKIASSTQAPMFREPDGYDWKPYAFGVKAKFSNEQEKGRNVSNWVIKDNGTLNASGFRMGRPIRDATSPVYDIEIPPFWVSCIARRLISFQTALSSLMKLPNMDWYFVCEVQTTQDQTFVRHDPHFHDYERIEFMKPIQMNAVRFRDAYDADGINLIEQKINNLFELESDPNGRAILFQTKETK